MGEATLATWPRVGNMDELSEVDIAEITRQAKEKGYAEGLAQGRAAAGAELEAQCKPVSALAAALDDYRLELEDQERTVLAEFLCQCFRSLVDREMSVDSSLVADLIETGLTKLSTASPVAVCLHPDHETAVAHVENVEFTFDAAVPLSEVRLTSDVACWHASVNEEFAQLVDNLLSPSHA